MSLFEDVVESVTPNALVAAGVLLATPIVLPIVRSGLRPLAKGAIKGYLTIQDKIVETVASTGERFSDLVAEAKSEHATAVAAAGVATAPEPQKGAGAGTKEAKEQKATGGVSR